MGNQMATQEMPPTFFRTNKFTSAFQMLINAYGGTTQSQKSYIHSCDFVN